MRVKKEDIEETFAFRDLTWHYTIRIKIKGEEYIFSQPMSEQAKDCDDWIYILDGLQRTVDEKNK